MHPHSFYAAYHLPTSSLRICLAETVLQQYEHGRKNSTDQQSLTVNFHRWARSLSNVISVTMADTEYCVQITDTRTDGNSVWGDIQIRTSPS